MLCACSSTKRPAEREGDWGAYGHDGKGTRYSALRNITPGNVARLAPAWVYHTHEKLDDEMAEKSAFEATPIVVDGSMYFSTPSGRVISLDPATGTEHWAFDPHINRSEDFSEVTSRGVSTWVDTRIPAGKPCRRRILVATIDARLIALDSATGALCADFGNGGTVDLTKGIGRTRPGEYQVTSPPAVIDDLIVVGSAIGDNGAAVLERGVVRAFDARRGMLRWSWDPIRDAAMATGAANAWAPISVDAERHLVFVPTSSPSPDYYGGLRPGLNADSDSVVALRSSTGQRVWGFQVVHHDLWDYDVASQPLLIDVPIDGRMRAAVAIGTKMGNIFVVDRDTGTPLFPVEERAVPRSEVEGEEAAETQPFPTFPPPLVPQRLSPDDAWGPTAADRQTCHDKIASLRSEGIFTPPSVRGTIAIPGNVGGINWGGMAWDPERHLLVAATNRIPFQVQLIPRAEYDARRSAGANSRVIGDFARMSGTPFGLYRAPLFSPKGIPCSAPPWGGLTAIDFSAKKIAWDIPLGFIPSLSAIPGFEKLGSFNLGGAMISGGLVFIAATMDAHLRAFDIQTGRELWSAELPAAAQANPMTYTAGGRQFVVIAAGGHGKLHTPLNDTLVAFAVK